MFSFAAACSGDQGRCVQRFTQPEALRMPGRLLPAPGQRGD
jgi:hypothetical protein